MIHGAYTASSVVCFCHNHQRIATVYFFKVRPECKVGSGLESDVSESIKTTTMLSGKPAAVTMEILKFIIATGDIM